MKCCYCIIYTYICTVIKQLKTMATRQSGLTIREMINKVRNIKTVKITIPNEQILKRLNSTPTFNRLSRLKLQVGENIENVNHAQFADMVRLYPLIGVTVEEVV